MWYVWVTIGNCVSGWQSDFRFFVVPSMWQPYPDPYLPSLPYHQSINDHIAVTVECCIGTPDSIVHPNYSVELHWNRSCTDGIDTDDKKMEWKHDVASVVFRLPLNSSSSSSSSSASTMSSSTIVSLDDKDVYNWVGHIGYCVEKEYQGHRLACYLTSMILHVAAAHGLSFVTIVSRPSNIASRATATRLGAIPIGDGITPCTLPSGHVLRQWGYHDLSRYRLDLRPWSIAHDHEQVRSSDRMTERRRYPSDSLSQRGMNGYNTVWDLRVNMPRMSFHNAITDVLRQHDTIINEDSLILELILRYAYEGDTDRGLVSTRPIDVPTSVYPLLL
jgi:hypothetical protein